MKTIYTSVSSESLYKFIKILEKKNNWFGDVIITNQNTRELIINDNKRIQNSLVLDTMKLRQGDFSQAEKLKFHSIDEQTLIKLSNYESNFLSWLEDTNRHNFSFDQRRLFYYEMLNFFNSIVKQHKPELLISFTWPHVPSDYALYLLCKHVYNIPVLFFDVIPFLDKPIRLICSSYDNMSEVVEKNKNKNLTPSLSILCDEYLKSMKERPEKMFIHKYLKDWYIENSYTFNKDFLKDLLFFFKTLLKFNLFQTASIAFKKNFKSFGKKSILNNFEYLIFKYKLLIKNFFNQRRYQILINKQRDKKLPEKFLYYPAPFQPEAATCIAQGKYENQFLVLDMLKETLPKEIKVVYKEHPGTFHGFSKGCLYKNKDYYRKLTQYDFIKFVDYKENSIELIDKSLGVISCSSTAGWEAVNRNKPCILFGSIWYQGCSEVFKINNINELNEALKKIILYKYKPNNEKIKIFFKSLIASTVYFPSKLNKTVELDEMLENETSLKLNEIFKYTYEQ